MNSINIAAKIIAYLVLLLAFVSFGLHMLYDFGKQFNYDMTYGYLPIAIAGALFSLFLILVQIHISQLYFLSVYHKKIINTLRILIYICIFVVFINWWLSISLFIVITKKLITSMVLLFFGKYFLIALLYSLCINIFFFSLSIPIRRQNAI